MQGEGQKEREERNPRRQSSERGVDVGLNLTVPPRCPKTSYSLISLGVMILVKAKVDTESTMGVLEQNKMNTQFLK